MTVTERNISLESIIEELHENHVDTVLDICGSEHELDYHQSVKEVFEKNNINFYAAAGIHPQESSNFIDSDISWIAKNRENIIAVGEVGLDFFYDFSPKEIQLKMLRTMIEQTIELEKPILIHGRCGEALIFDMLNEYGFDKRKVLFQSANGYIYGTARLESGTLDSVDIRVAPKDVYSVWHSGGGTDRFINYWVRNQYGENFVEAEYAYQTGGTHLIAWPCAHVGIEEPAEGSDSRSVELYPVPTSGKLTVRAEGLQKVDILDIGGRTIVSSTVATLDLSDLPNGMYFVRVTTTSGSSVQRIVKK